MLVVVAQVRGFAYHGNREVPHQEALADAGIQHGRFDARIGADDQQRVGILDPGDGAVEQIPGPQARVGLGAVLAAIDVRRAQTGHQRF